MSGLARRGATELEVEDFGPIVEARIDLRPLTVFVGPSNTGKSCLALLIYALHRYFSGTAIFGSHRASRWYRRFRDDREESVPEETMEALVEAAGRISEKRKRSETEERMALPPLVAEEMRSAIDAKGEQLVSEIVRCFGIREAGGLIRKAANNGARIGLRRRSSNDSILFEHALAIRASGQEFETDISSGASIRIDVEHDSDGDYMRDVAEDLISSFDRRDEDDKNYLGWELAALLTSYALPQFVEPLNLPAFYLPADRAGVVDTHRVITGGLIGNAPVGGAHTAALGPMLTGSLADFLQQLLELDRPPNGQSTLVREVGAQIESAVLGGSVHVETSELIGFPHFTYQPEGWKDRLPLMNASSMVSEIAPVVLYLRHLVQPGNVLIVEEPESHLHPAAQVEFTRQLSALVRAGVRVIVTTHSEWVLQELANTVQRSALPAPRRKEVSGAEVALRPDEVGAWLFKSMCDPKGSTVEEMKLDEEIGLYPTDYDAVSESLYDENVRIFNRIQDGKAG